MATGAEAVGKSPEAFRTISEVAAFLETPAHVLRFWESKFPQIRPVKRAGGRRYYRPDDIALLGGIKVLLHEQGMTIRGVQKLLKEKGPRYVATLSTLPWEGEAVEEADPAPDMASDPAPEAVIVGPWPAAREETPAPSVAGELDADEESAGFTLAEAPEARPAPEAPAGAACTVARLREALARADRDRLRAEAGRLVPLVRRLAALREGPAAFTR